MTRLEYHHSAQCCSLRDVMARRPCSRHVMNRQPEAALYPIVYRLTQSSLQQSRDAQPHSSSRSDRGSSICQMNVKVGFLCAAGGKGSYMSIMSLANSLMLDFRCLVLPRFVYSVGEDFGEGEVTDPKVKERVMELAKELDRICVALNK